MVNIIPFTTVKSPFYYHNHSAVENIETSFPSDGNGLNRVQYAILKSLYDVRKEMGDHPYTRKTQYYIGTVLQKFPFSIDRVADDIYQMVRSGYLIEGQGNFGIYDDPLSPGNFEKGACVTYTEIMLSDFAYDCMSKGSDDVMFALPILLIQGAYVVVSHRKCTIPPHHLSDIIDSAIAYLKGEEYNLQPVKGYHSKKFNEPVLLFSDSKRIDKVLRKTTVKQIFEDSIDKAKTLFDSPSDYITWLEEMKAKYCSPNMSRTVCQEYFERQMNFLKTEHK